MVRFGGANRIEVESQILCSALRQSWADGPAEVKALKNQMEFYPEMSLIDLVLQSGYITERELKSLQLAEYLLSSGKITMGQFRANLDGEPRWDNFFFSPPDDQLEPSPVPRRPRPDAGEGGIALPLPDPPEAHPES